MQTATFRDLTLGRLQNTMAETPLSGFYQHQQYHNRWLENLWTYVLFLSTLGCCMYSCVVCCRTKRESTYDLQGNLKEALLGSIRKKKNDDSDSDNYGDDETKKKKKKSSSGTAAVEKKPSNDGSEDSKEKSLIENDHSGGGQLA